MGPNTFAWRAMQDSVADADWPDTQQIADECNPTLAFARLLKRAARGAALSDGSGYVSVRLESNAGPLCRRRLAGYTANRGRVQPKSRSCPLADARGSEGRICRVGPETRYLRRQPDGYADGHERLHPGARVCPLRERRGSRGGAVDLSGIFKWSVGLFADEVQGDGAAVGVSSMFEDVEALPGAQREVASHHGD